ncbi:hypothetical protein, partial [Sphingomonas sp. DC1200-1]|uniref:hypothetical protein n=1 Tax=Sphingomonas sp. DC1200-1 TaxID=2804660 RepID=UPI003CF6E691
MASRIRRRGSVPGSGSSAIFGTPVVRRSAVAATNAAASARSLRYRDQDGREQTLTFGAISLAEARA